MGIAALAVCVPASADERPQTTIVGSNGKVLPRESAWVKKAFVPPPSGKIIVRSAPCPNHPEFDACVQSWHKRTIYLRPGTVGVKTVFLHEVGHVFDLTALRTSDRTAFKRLVDRPGGWWTGQQRTTGEWFADAYSLCARKRVLSARAAPSNYGYAPAPGTHAAACRLIARAAKRLEQGPPSGPSPEPAPPTVAESPAAPAPVRQPYRCLLILTCYRPG